MKKRLLQQLARGEDWFVRGSTLIFYSFAGRYRGLTGDITPVLPGALHAAGSEDGFHPVTIPRCTGRGRVTLPVLSKSDTMFIILSSERNAVKGRGNHFFQLSTFRFWIKYSTPE